MGKFSISQVYVASGNIRRSQQKVKRLSFYIIVYYMFNHGSFFCQINLSLFTIELHD